MSDLRFFCRIADILLSASGSLDGDAVLNAVSILYYGLPLPLAILFSVAGFFSSFAGFFSSVASIFSSLASILISLADFFSPLAAGSLVFEPCGPLRRLHLHLYLAQSSSDSAYHSAAMARCVSAKFACQPRTPPIKDYRALVRKVQITRQLSYRKEDRAMRPIYGCPEKFRESSLSTRLLFQKFVMDFCSDRY